jgi:hypothetical protein
MLVLLQEFPQLRRGSAGGDGLGEWGLPDLLQELGEAGCVGPVAEVEVDVDDSGVVGGPADPVRQDVVLGTGAVVPVEA